MINKKRLAMMAVAASMILPSNLTYLSTITPILAAETQDPKTPLDDIAIVTKDRGDGTSAPCLSQGTYEITADTTLTQTNPTWIPTGESVKIYLNGNTLSSSALWVFGLRDGATLEIIGPGSLESTATDGEGGVLFLRGEGGKLTVRDEVTIKHGASKGWGITIAETAPSSTVTLTNSTIQAKQGGLTVNGNMFKDEEVTLDSDKLPTITLDKVTMDVKGGTKSVGIYQAGLSNVVVKNSSTITSDNCGIETRAGVLSVLNSTVTGGKATLDVKPDESGTTTENAGISVAQHVTDKPIELTVTNSTIEGGAAVSITDPQEKQESSTDEDITININNSSLKGTDYAVAYTESTIPFNLKDTNLNGGKVQKLVEADTLSNGTSIFATEDGSLKEEDMDTLPEADRPFKITTTSYKPSGGSSKPKPKPEEPAQEPMTPVGTPTSMYRLYNKLTGEHLYTIDKNERDNLLTSDTWKDEGEGWIAPSVSNYPVYRLLNPNNGDHHYTTDKNEFDTLPSLGWVAEGVAFFSADKDNPENVLLHRVYNPNAKGAGSHHYTADTNERDTLVTQGWTYEGLAWAGLSANK